MRANTTKYKQTELGLIPDDWDVKTINDFTEKVGSGITPTGGSNVYKKQGRPFVRSQNVGWGNLILDDIAFIDEETHKTFPNTELKLNDVLLNISGASIGRSSYVIDKLVGGNVNQHVCIIRTTNRLNPKFLNSFLLSKKGQQQIDSFQSGGNRQGLNISQIKTFNIPIPPTIEEQTAIANALSDIDAFIDSLENLIEKKKLLKQGALQKLLKPKKGWVNKKLGEVAKIYTGTRNNQDKIEDGFYPFFVRSQTIERINSFSYDGEAILIPGEGNVGKIFHYINGKFDFHQRVYVINNFSDWVCAKFLYYYLLKNFGNYALSSSVKATVDSLRLPVFTEFEMNVPSSYDEQEEIANILTDMDKENELLQTKLNKYKQIKLGMMQNLLTGKIRLV